MDVIGAVGSLFASMLSRQGRLDRFSAGPIHRDSLGVLRVQFGLRPQPMRCFIALAPTVILPNLIGPAINAFVTD